MIPKAIARTMLSVLVSLVALAPARAEAQLMTDQVVGPLLNTATTPFHPLIVAQSFKVGVTGVFHHLDFFGFPVPTSAGTVMVSLHPLAPNGIPDLEAPLAAVAVHSSSILHVDWTTVDFSTAEIQVLAGQTLAVVWRPTGDMTFGLYRGCGGYVDGNVFTNFSTGQPVLELDSTCADYSIRTFICARGDCTVANTLPGSRIDVAPVTTLPDGTVTSTAITFETVEQAGDTTVGAFDTPSTGTASSPPGFKVGQPAVYYDVETTAVFTGTITLCFSWQEGQFHNEQAIRLFHLENGAWVDVTTSSDPAGNLICGAVTSLSPFAAFERSYTFGGFLPPVQSLPARNLMSAGAAIPIRFQLTGGDGLSILDAGYPASQLVTCATGSPLAVVEETTTAGGSSLSYHAQTGVYTYVWKTEKGWAGSCRQLVLRFNDGSSQTLQFELK